jgi:hypothetical protein
MKRLILALAASFLIAPSAHAYDWRHRVAVDEFTDRQSHLTSTSWLEGRNEMTALLVCRDMVPSFIISTDDYQGRGTAAIMYRVGERPAVSKSVTLSANGQSVYIDEKQDVWSMMLGLLEGRLLFSVTDFKGSRLRTSIPGVGAEPALRETPCTRDFFVWYDAQQAEAAAKKQAADAAAEAAAKKQAADEAAKRAENANKAPEGSGR